MKANSNLAAKRRDMVEQQLAARGISDPAVLGAMGEIPREEFVPERLRDLAYDDAPLPIGEDQTISQPFIVALMSEALELSEEDRVLEVGTGSGYGAAVLSRIARQVHTVERSALLAARAEERLRRLGIENVFVHQGDGTLGWPEEAPYDGIVVTAGAPGIPEPLEEQLASGGRLVIPAGSSPRFQELIRLRKGKDGETMREVLAEVRFVPLVGEHGWKEPGF